jgi:hypothetical protein
MPELKPKRAYLIDGTDLAAIEKAARIIDAIDTQASKGLWEIVGLAKYEDMTRS